MRDAYFLDSLVLILLWGALSAAWNVAGGYAGQVSIGHAAFFGIGAYSAALLGTRWHQSPWLGMLVGVAALARGRCAPSAILSNRLKGPYFALSTIAFSQVLLIVASRWRAFTSGSEGIPVPFRPGFATLGLGHVAWVYLALVVAVLYWGIQVWLEHSRFGYRLAGVREDEDAAQALGIPARRLKVIAVTASAALTSVCGTLWAQYVGFVDPSTSSRSISRCASRSTRSSAAWAPPRPLPGLDPHHVAGDLSARHAVRREVGLHRHLPDRLRGRPDPRRALRARGAGRPAPPGCARGGRGPRRERAGARPSCSALERVTKRFGGLTAVRDVSLEVRSGDLLGIIGPNGAGKTTLFNVISGYYRPDEGRVVFDGRDVTGQPAHAISRAGADPHLPDRQAVRQPLGPRQRDDRRADPAGVHARRRGPTPSA